MSASANNKGLRQPRAAFEKSLRKILQRISCGEWVDLQWNDSFLPGGPFTGKAKATALWVVGSFARGAEYCGDLDIVVQANTAFDSFAAPNRTVCGALTGALPYVRTYLGTPEKNSSFASFNDAVLLWSEDEPNWEEALSIIRTNPDEGRQEREWDVIPFRMEQVGLRDPDKLLEQKESGIIEWQWIEWEDLTSIKAVESNIPQRKLGGVKIGRSAKFGECLDLAARYLSQDVPAWAWECYESPGGFLPIGGYAVSISACPVVRTDLLNSISFHAILIMPYRSKRGPNGAWLIKRGPNHPLSLMFKQITAYAKTDENGNPGFFNTGDANYPMQVVLAKKQCTGTTPVTGGDLLWLLAQVWRIKLAKTSERYLVSKYISSDHEKILLEKMRKWKPISL